MESLLLPSIMRFEEGASENEATFVVEPFYHGYGTTVGNAIRRVLLSSLPGAAVTAVKIKGVQHEFTAVPGVKEDALEVVLNLKSLRLRSHSEEPVKLSLNVSEKGVVKASQFEANADVEIVNPNLVIATVTGDEGLEMEITVERGRGYSPTEERESSGELGLIAIDALFSPVRRVGLKVENTRVGEITNFDKMLMEIETDGSITPQEAVDQSLEILLDHFNLIKGQVGSGATPEPSAETDAPEETEKPEEVEEADSSAE